MRKDKFEGLLVHDAPAVFLAVPDERVVHPRAGDMGSRVRSECVLVEPPDALELDVLVRERFCDGLVHRFHRVLPAGDAFEVPVKVGDDSKPLAEVIQVLLEAFYLLLRVGYRVRWIHCS